MGNNRRGTKNFSIAFGLFWRNKDALMARFSVNFYGVDVGAVYDFNVLNDLQSISRARGAFELFLRYRVNFSSFKSHAMYN